MSGIETRTELLEAIDEIRGRLDVADLADDQYEQAITYTEFLENLLIRRLI